MTDFPSSYTEKWQIINGKEEPITTFLADKVTPVPREGNEDCYTNAEDRLHALGYSIADFGKEIMQIHREDKYSPVFCKTAMLVGASKGTWEKEAFTQCIEAMFRTSGGDRAARNVNEEGKKQWERNQNSE